MTDNDSRPVPDPTTLTTAALYREIQHLERLVFDRFALEERNRVEQKNDTKQAVDAALIAQKEAVKEQTIASEKAIDKSEANTSKQIEEQGKTFGADIDNLKERVGKIESVKVGGREQTANIYAFIGFLAALVVLGGAVLALR